jgi:uncharacterized membrane protein YbhN (UPF0104 family)
MQPRINAIMCAQIIEKVKELVYNFQVLGNKNQWLRITTFIIAILFLVMLLIIGWNNRETILPFLIQADYSQLAGYFALYLVSYTATVSGWLTVIQSFDNQLDWWTHTQIYCMTMATRLLPGTLWYVGGRMVLYQRLGLSRTITLLANAIELIVLYTIASIAGFVFLLLSRLSLATTTLIVLTSSAFIAILTLRPSFFNWVLKKINAPESAKISSKRIALWVVFYSINWLTGGLMLNQLVNVFKPGGMDQTLYVIGAWMLSSTASLLTFLLPSGFGLKELALTALLAPILPLPLAGAVAILMRFFTFFLEITVSIIFYFVGLKSPRLGNILNTRQNI